MAEVGNFSYDKRGFIDLMKRRGITDVAVLSAMASVPREYFVESEHLAFAYDDSPLPIAEGQTISQPYMVAYMIADLRLEATDRVLEIGTGSGYAAAVLSRLARRVYTVERHQSLAATARSRLSELGYDNIEILCGDGTLGWPQHAPFDAIVCTAGAPSIPPSLFSQLALGGRLVIPVGGPPQRLLRVTRLGEDEKTVEELAKVRFVPLLGEEGWQDEG